MTQRKVGDEKSITFMTSPFKNSEVRYSALEKQGFILVRVVKKFRHYILRNKIYMIVPNQAINSLLM